MAKAKFGSLMLLCQGILVILFVVFVDDGEELVGSKKTDVGRNTVRGFRDLHVSTFLGFGLIMTFLRRYSRGMLVHVFLIGALVIQWATLLQGFFSMNKSKIDVGMMRMINADFAVVSVLISLGAIMGKCNSVQLLVVGLVETLFYAVNEVINLQVLKASDLGRSIVVHVFGAFFGLAVSRMIFSSKVCMSQALSMTSKSEMYSFIGTLFLWTYWPSVNALLVEGTCEKRALANTFYALAACCTASFSFTVLQSKESRFNIFHLQNATLAGGVVIGSIASMSLTPWGSVIAGIVGALGSVLGYKYCVPKLRRSLKIHDTRGVSATHGVPGVISGIASVLVAFLANEGRYESSLYVLYPARAPAVNSTKLLELQKFASIPAGENRTAGVQALYQLACLVITITLAIIGGLITGVIIRLKFFEPVSVNDAFDDHIDFEEKNCIDVSSDVEYEDENDNAKHRDVVHGKRRCMTDGGLSQHDNGRSIRSSHGNSENSLLLNNKGGNNYIDPSNEVELDAINTTETTDDHASLLGDENEHNKEHNNDCHSATVEVTIEECTE